MNLISMLEYCTAVFAIPESKPTDTVSYKIFKVSDGSVFMQGNCAYVAGINWKVVFQPETEDIFIVEVDDQAVDAVFSQIFKVIEKKAG